MTEENQDLIEQNEPEWQAPPLPEEILDVKEPAQMSEVGTLGSIFFEPGRTFEDLRRKPRFLLAGLIIIFLVTLFQFAFIERIGFERVVREQFETNSSIQQMPDDQKQKFMESQSSPNAKIIRIASIPIVSIIVFLIGGLIYWLGANAMGGSARFTHGLSVWIYSSLPPAVIFTLANLLVLFLKSPDDIEVSAAQNSLLPSNPGFFVSGKSSPVLESV